MEDSADLQFIAINLNHEVEKNPAILGGIS